MTGTLRRTCHSLVLLVGALTVLWAAPAAATVPERSAREFATVPERSAREFATVPERSAREFATVPERSAREFATVPERSARELADVPERSARELADEALVISGLETDSGIVRFTLTARGLPADVSLDPASVRVRVGETVLRSEANATTSAEDLPPRALVVVVDATSHVTAGQLDTAKAALGGLASALPPDVQLGLVSVTTGASTVVAPTTDRNAYTAALTAMTPSGASPLAEGIVVANQELASGGLNADSDRRVVVFSDGTQPASGLTDPALQASLRAGSAPVDVLAFGADAGGLTRLRAYADATEGRLLEAEDHAGAVQAALSAGRVFSDAIAVTAFVPSQLGSRTSNMDVVAEGTGLSTSLLVTFGAPVTQPTQPRIAGPSVLAWIPAWVVYVPAVAVFVALVAIVLALAWPRSLKQARIKQIAHFGPARTAPARKPEPGSAGGVIARTALAATASVVRSGGMEQRISLRLDRAGMRLRAHEWVLVRVCITVATAVLLFAVADWRGAVMGLLLGWLLTVLYQSIRVDRRANQFAEQLPDALQLVIGSLKSGFSLPQALDSLVRESPEPVSAEFGRALAEHRLGADVSDALERLAHRTESEDLGWAVMAVRIQREVGGNLAEVLQTTVDTMRERGRLRRHVRSLSAEGRLSAWVLIGLPLVLGGFMFFFRPDYMTPLVTDPLGLTMLIAGGLLFVIGIVWMSRVIKVEA